MSEETNHAVEHETIRQRLNSLETTRGRIWKLIWVILGVVVSQVLAKLSGLF